MTLELVHLERQEYQDMRDEGNHRERFRIVVLNCGIAGIVRYFVDEGYCFYDDLFYAEDEMVQKKSKQNYWEMHAEVYLNMALMNNCYNA